MSPRQSRFLALLLLVVAILAAAAAIALPAWMLNQRYDNFLEDYTDRLNRYRRVAALRPAIEKATKEVEARAGRQFYLKASSPALSAAELQGMVTKIIETHNGKIASSQALPARDDGKSSEPAKVTISVQLTAPIIPLMMILHTLETSRPYLFVDGLTVWATQGRAYKAVPGIQPEYTVQLTISGFALPGGGKS